MPAETEEALNFQGLCHYIGRLSKAAKAGMKAALADTPKCHFAWLEALLHAIRSRGPLLVEMFARLVGKTKSVMFSNPFPIGEVR